MTTKFTSKLMKILPILLLPLSCYVQILVAQTSTPTYISHEVRQIDEFITRFNNEKVLGNVNLPPQNRPNAITNLFYAGKSNWNLQQIEQFTKQVTHPNVGQKLNFYDKDWYAQLECDFLYNGKPQKITLTLENIAYPDLSSKWIIVGANGTCLKQLFQDNLVVTLPFSCNNTNAINPMAHTTNFSSLYHLLNNDKENLNNYFCNSCPNATALDKIANAIYQGKLKLVQINKITYHFLEIKNWTFTVEQFNNQTNNNGWLISSLQANTEKDKKTYKKTKLYLE